MKYISIPLFLLMWGCSTPQSVIQSTIDNIIRIDTVTIYTPADPVYSPIVLDSYGFGENNSVQVRVDTIYKVKQIYVKGKADTIRIPIRDTITVTRTEIKTVESNDLTIKEMFLWATGIIGMVLLIQLLKR